MLSSLVVGLKLCLGQDTLTAHGTLLKTLIILSRLHYKYDIG